MRPASLPAVAVAVLAVGALLTWACSHSASVVPSSASPRPLPTGAYGKLVRYGRDIVGHTRSRMPQYVGAAMSCEACHIGVGTKPHGGSFVGIYADYPRWSPRAHRFIALQDRIAECFLYSMNGRPPAYTSREMEALVAYVAWLSKGQRVGSRPKGAGFPEFQPEHPAAARAGATVYAQRCAACHATSGAGDGGFFPPVWGPKSFNDGAGMQRLSTMAAFVRYNMPYGSPPNSLSKQQAYDVAAFILAHERPHFDPSRAIAFPPESAGFF